MEHTERIHGRFSLHYDYDFMRWEFSTSWSTHGFTLDCDQRRTVTEQEAAILKRILMGGFIKRTR